MSKINGFTVVNFGDPALKTFPIPGTTARLSLRKEVAALMVGLARDFNLTVEPLNHKSCWGHDHRKISGSNQWSFHAPGIAIDLNASAHPRGSSGTFDRDQVKAIRKLLANWSHHGVKLFRWGGDFNTIVDEMHFEIIVPRATALAAVEELRPVGTTSLVPVPTPHAPGSRLLKVTSTPMEGRDVKYVQNWIGDPCGTPDGNYGNNTRKGVIWYQGMRGIAVTGECDKVTWRNMRIEPTF
jgi:hypothetical protein